jgi:signal transduction histidine kinase
VKLFHKYREFPHFLRIFVLILAGIAGVQLFNVALVILGPTPPPIIFSVSRVAAALRSGMDGSGELAISEGPPMDLAPSDPALGKSAAELARLLNLPAACIVLHTSRARQFLFGGPPNRPGERAMSDSAREKISAELLFGGFVASAEIAPGHWRSARPSRNELAIWRWLAFRWLIGAMLASAPIAWLLARRAARPIAMFARAADRLGRDPRAPALPIEGPPEIAEAAAAFNQMQARLTRYVDDRAMLTAAIAHDLRTPLMRAMLRIDEAPEPLREALEADISEMDLMIMSVLGFLREISVPAHRKRLDLRALVESVTDDYVDRQQPVALSDGPSPVIEADGAGLKTLVENLVSNALKYGGNAFVSICQWQDHVVLEVRDTGPGIAADELEQVFKPFFRLEESRNRHTGGVGLGLSSARSVARAHGGDVVLENQPEGGLLARVTLPL